MREREKVTQMQNLTLLNMSLITKDKEGYILNAAGRRIAGQVKENGQFYYSSGSNMYKQM